LRKEGNQGGKEGLGEGDKRRMEGKERDGKGGQRGSWGNSALVVGG